MILPSSGTHRTLIVITLIVVICALSYTAYHAFDNRSANLEESWQRERLQRELIAISNRDLVVNPGKPVSVIVYEDTDCDFCAVHADTIDEILERRQNDISVVHRYHFLPIYKHSRDEASYLECVKYLNPHAYGAFRQLLFNVRSSEIFDSQVLADAAHQYVSSEKLSECLNDPATQKDMNEVDAIGSLAGVGRVPHTFIFSEGSPLFTLVGVQPAKRIEDLIDLALQYE